MLVINTFPNIFKIMLFMHDVKPSADIIYDFKQSMREVVPKLPMRAMNVGPSGSGKSTLLVSMIFDIYRGAGERIFIWSPSVNLDTIWLPVKKYIEEGLKVDTDKEPCRGRHNGISTLIIRVSISHLLNYEVRNFKEIGILQDELSAIVRSDVYTKARN